MQFDRQTALGERLDEMDVLCPAAKLFLFFYKSEFFENSLMIRMAQRDPELKRIQHISRFVG